MRVVALLVALLLVAAVIYFGYAAATRLGAGRARRQHRAARWQVRHRGADGHTVVSVVLTSPTGEEFDEHVVVGIPDGDPDWQSRFLAARQEAEERAFHLNADR
jgi:pyridoxamine 5'-phosphate oxidase family protein